MCTWLDTRLQYRPYAPKQAAVSSSSSSHEIASHSATNHACGCVAVAIALQLENGACHQCQEQLSLVLLLQLVAAEMRIVVVYVQALLQMLGMTELITVL
jgi:hypothetical protein